MEGEDFTMDIIEQFQILLDPATTSGAFIISLAATFIGGFFVGRSSVNQKGKNVGGDMNQNSTIVKRK